MDFDKDEATLNTHWNKINNRVDYLLWLQKEMELGQDLVDKALKELDAKFKELSQ